MAMITDYDCWKVEEDNVNAHSVIEHIQANAASAREILEKLIPLVPTEPDWPEHKSLDNALFTPREIWPTNTAEALRPILSRFINS
jgi:5'-methylthioadenosine phosphorylase